MDPGIFSGHLSYGNRKALRKNRSEKFSRSVQTRAALLGLSPPRVGPGSFRDPPEVGLGSELGGSEIGPRSALPATNRVPKRIDPVLKTCVLWDYESRVLYIKIVPRNFRYLSGVDPLN